MQITPLPAPGAFMIRPGKKVSRRETGRFNPLTADLATLRRVGFIGSLRKVFSIFFYPTLGYFFELAAGWLLGGTQEDNKEVMWVRLGPRGSLSRDSPPRRSEENFPKGKRLCKRMPAVSSGVAAFSKRSCPCFFRRRGTLNHAAIRGRPGREPA